MSYSYYLLPIFRVKCVQKPGTENTKELMVFQNNTYLCLYNFSGSNSFNNKLYRERKQAMWHPQQNVDMTGRNASSSSPFSIAYYFNINVKQFLWCIFHSIKFADELASGILNLWQMTIFAFCTTWFDYRAPRTQTRTLYASVVFLLALILSYITRLAGIQATDHSKYT